MVFKMLYDSLAVAGMMSTAIFTFHWFASTTMCWATKSIWCTAHINNGISQWYIVFCITQCTLTQHLHDTQSNMRVVQSLPFTYTDMIASICTANTASLSKWNVAFGHHAMEFKHLFVYILMLFCLNTHHSMIMIIRSALHIADQFDGVCMLDWAWNIKWNLMYILSNNLKQCDFGFASVHSIHLLSSPSSVSDNWLGWKP